MPAAQHTSRSRHDARRPPPPRRTSALFSTTPKNEPVSRAVRRGGKFTILLIHRLLSRHPETQNWCEKSQKTSEQNEGSAHSRAISSLGAFAATRQHGRVETRESAEKNGQFLQPATCPAAAPANGPPQNHPPFGEKSPNPSGKQTPPLAKVAQECENSFLRVIPQLPPPKCDCRSAMVHRIEVVAEFARIQSLTAR